MKKSLFLYQGRAAQARGAGRFAKDILRTGLWTHPTTKQEVMIDSARLEKLAQNTNKYLRHVDRERIPFPDGHTFAADKNLGWWPGPFFVLDDKLYSVVQPTDPETTRKMENGSIAAVSAMIEFGRADAHGNDYDEVITHVCATPYPVIDGQRDFMKLSAETPDAELYIPQELAGTSPEGHSNKEGRMDPKLVRKALGLPEDASDADVTKALEKAGQAASKLSAVEAERTTAVAALNAQGFELKDGKVVKLAAAPAPDVTVKPTDSPEVAELKKLVASQGSQLSSQQTVITGLLDGSKKTQAQNAQALAQQLVQEGRIPPAMQATLAEVLAINGEAQTLVLSTEGKAVEKGINLVDRLQSIFKSMPSIKGQQLSTLGQPADAGEAKAAKDRQSEAKNIARRVSGKKETEAAGAK